MKLQQYFCVIKWRDWSAGQTRRVESSVQPQMHVFIFSLWKHNWILRQKWQNYLILAHFSNKKRLSNKKEYCSCEIVATHAGFGHIQVGMATKLHVFVLNFDSIHGWRSSASCELDKSLKTRLENHFQMQQFVHGKCTSFTTLMELLKLF